MNNKVKDLTKETKLLPIKLSLMGTECVANSEDIAAWHEPITCWPSECVIDPNEW